MKPNLQNVSMQELWDIRKEIYQQDYFFSSPMSIISKHFLGHFSGFEEIFSMPFEAIREQFLESSGQLKDEIPTSEEAFFQFICSEYFFLSIAPYSRLLDLYKKAFSHVEQIKKNINYCKQEKQLLEERKNNLRSEGRIVDEEILYASYMLDHYLELNESAQKEIVDFIFSECIYEAAHLRAQKDPFGIKSRPLYNFDHNPNAFDRKSFSDISNKFLTLKIREHKDVEALYEEDRFNFYQFMHDYIESNNIPNEILALIEQNHYLNRRSYILKPALDQYKNGAKAIFLHIAPLQIEGMFYDYCTALGISEGEVSTSSIAGKLDRIVKLSNGFYSFEYFKFRFPIIRNKIAHGKTMDEEEINFFSDFVLLDLLDVSERLSSSDYPLNKVLAYIKNAYDFNDIFSLIGLAFAVAKNFNIPDFYQVKNMVSELEVRFQNDDFFECLFRLIKLDNRIINGGIRVIMNYFRNRNLMEKKCTEVFKLIKDNYTSRFDLMDFINEIDSNACSVDS